MNFIFLLYCTGALLLTVANVYGGVSTDGIAASNQTAAAVDDLMALNLRKDYTTVIGLCFILTASVLLAVRLAQYNKNAATRLAIVGEMIVYGVLSATFTGYLWDARSISAATCLMLAAIMGVASAHIGADITKLCFAIIAKVINTIHPGAIDRERDDDVDKNSAA